MNEFEQKLSRQPLRKIPDEWRVDILRAAERNVRAPAASKWNWQTALTQVFWPNQKAWGALAAIWIFIFILNFSMRDQTPVVAEKIAPPSPEMIAELKQQKLLFAELIGANDLKIADRQKLFSPKPRSEYAEILAA